MIKFERLNQNNIDSVKNFFTDEQTIKYVGNKEWIEDALNRPAIAIGKEFRGVKVVDRSGFLVYEDESVFGYFEIERYSGRFKENADTEIDRDGITGNFVYVVDPSKRGLGLGFKLVDSLVKSSEFSDVRYFIASTDLGNDASERILLRLGFNVESTDEDGTKNWILARF